jgi:hypothetical protein
MAAIRIPRKLDAEIGIAKYRNIANYVPKIGDFVIWHGFWKRWYGVIIDINGGTAYILKENLPKLLFTIPDDERVKNTIKISISRIRSSRGGEYHIIQGETWFIDD